MIGGHGGIVSTLTARAMHRSDDHGYCELAVHGTRWRLFCSIFAFSKDDTAAVSSEATMAARNAVRRRGIRVASLSCRHDSCGPLRRRGSAPPRRGVLCHTGSVSKNLTRTAHVALPADVLADIDKLVGKRSRSAFLTELAQREIKIRRQREALREAAGAWKSEDHPELVSGAAAWIRQIRALDDQRFEELERRRAGK